MLVTDVGDNYKVLMSTLTLIKCHQRRNAVTNITVAEINIQ